MDQSGRASRQPEVTTGPSGGPARPGFVGRRDELAAVTSALEEAFAGRGGLVLLSGEPGIGKSRLADELAERARARDAAVLWGRCWEAGGAPAYWPWVQALRGYVRSLDPSGLEVALGEGAAEIAQILPEVRARLPELPSPAALDPEGARFRLFDAVTALLESVAADRSLVLILDDLHAADEPSLLLLRFAAAGLSDARALLVACYRDVDPTLDDPLAATVADLSRLRGVHHLGLAGLGRDEVGRFLEMVGGAVPSAALVRAVHEETEGNPLFVGEVGRLLAEEGRLGEAAHADTLGPLLPAGVRAVIGRRLDRLSDACRRLLGVAAVLGREFELAVLERLADEEGSRLLALLDEAVEARLTDEVPGTLLRLRFSHALVRETLYERLPRDERIELHRRAGEALEALHAGDLEPRLSELAHHFLEAAPGGDAARAVDYGRRAGDRASALLAYEEAARAYRTALRALDPSPDESARCDLLLALGDALMRAGDVEAMREAFLEAARIARERDLPERLARAAIGYGGRFVWVRAGADRELVPLLEEALGRIPAESDELRVRLLSRLAGALRDEPSRERRDHLSAEAVAIARRLADPAVLAYALVARYTATWGPENTEELLEIATEALRLAEEAGALERVVEGRHVRFIGLLILGDRTAADAELAAAAPIVARLRQPFQDWYEVTHRTLLALMEGRYADAQDLIARATATVSRSENPDADVAYRLQMFGLRREQGRLDELVDSVRRSVEEYPGHHMFRSMLTYALAASGRGAEAQAALDALSIDGFAAVPRDIEFLFAMSLLGETAVLLGDTAAGASISEALVPFAGLVALSPPELSLGSIARVLGMLAAGRARYDEAAEHFERALDIEQRMHARPWGAHARVGYARMLLGRDAPGDPERARDLLARALETADALGMAALREDAADLLARFDLSDGPPSSVETGVFRREGDAWLLSFGGRAVRLRDSKGLRYLHVLLGAAGRELHVSDLVAAVQGTSGGATTAREPGLAVGGTDAGPVIDLEARGAYARRVQELREEIDQMESWGDDERAARAREELEFVSRELAAAYGLGGRARRAADTVERARKAVTNRIRDVLARIERDHPSLGRHLANAVRTGTFCSYLPDRPVRWSLVATLRGS